VTTGWGSMMGAKDEIFSELILRRRKEPILDYLLVDEMVDDVDISEDEMKRIIKSYYQNIAI